MAALRAMRADFAEVGWRAMLTYYCGRALAAMHLGSAVHYVIMAVDMAAVASFVPDKRLSGFALVPADQVNSAADVMDAPASVLANRRAAGASPYCLVAPSGSAQASLWAQDTLYVEDEVAARFKLPDNAVWDFGVFVPPQHRHGRTLERLWALFAQACVAAGTQWSVSRVASHNRPSLRAHKRLPHRLVGHCYFFRLAGFQLKLGSLSPHIHIGRAKGAGPLLIVPELI